MYIGQPIKRAEKLGTIKLLVYNHYNAFNLIED